MSILFCVFLQWRHCILSYFGFSFGNELAAIKDKTITSLEYLFIILLHLFMFIEHIINLSLMCDMGKRENFVVKREIVRKTMGKDTNEPCQ